MTMAKQTSPAVSQGEDTAGARGFFALPSGGTGPGVLVLHAWWGLNDTIRGVCTRLAADTIAGAEALGSALDANHQQAKAEIAAAAAVLDRLTGGAGIGVLGFSLGAYYALDLAAATPEHIHSVVLFYGSGGGDFSASRAAYLGHFAANDPYEPAENVEALADTLRHAGRQATFHTYPGTGHWFFEPDRADAFDAAAAALAWERTLAFLQRPAS
jgi:carboxymethylenebutenolidase